MAITATLVFVGHDSLRYLLSQDGAAGTTATITSTGAASPDLLTDSVAGPIKKLAKAFTDGYGPVAAGVLTQAQARALWLSDRVPGNPLSIQDPTGASSLIATAIAAIIPRGTLGNGSNWTVDANVDGGGHPTLNIVGQAAAGSAYLDVKLPNTIGA